MLYRSIWNDLMKWKSRAHHPLIISGLRQTGKTYIVKAFGAKHYQHLVYLDLRANRSVHSAFAGDFDVDRMILGITALVPSVRFVPGQTLLVLDEIQDCPNARSSLKYWDQDGRFDVIATGSFLGVKGFREPYPRGIPVGYEEHLEMHPLTFEEFLKNAGISGAVFDHVQTAIQNMQSVDKPIHEAIRALFLQYLIIGGMPEAVTVFLSTHDINAVQSVQRRILRSIRDDFGRYKDPDGNDKVNEVLKLRAEACLDSLPAQLAKEYKKFQYSLVNARGNSPEKADGLQYLRDVGIVVTSYNIREISAPLEGVKIPTECKVFYADTGLLVSQLEHGVLAEVLQGRLGSYKGAIAENMVAAAFASSGIDLYYFHAPSGSPELDFVFSQNGKTVIVECKATNNRTTSMKFVLSHPQKYGVHPAIKFADTNVGHGDDFVTLPLYAVGFMKEQEDTLILPEILIPEPMNEDSTD